MGDHKMARESSAAATPKTLYCNHCKQPAQKRRDLDERWLCGTCRGIPGVRGYEDPLTRGLRGGSAGYWERTKGQLNIIGGDELATAPAAATSATVDEFGLWQQDVRTSTLDPMLKMYLVVGLVQFADWETGANCFASLGKQAAALGLTIMQVRRLRRLSIAAGWIRVHRMVSHWRRTSDLHQFIRPSSASHGAWEGPMVHDKYPSAKLLTVAESIVCSAHSGVRTSLVVLPEAEQNKLGCSAGSGAEHADLQGSTPQEDTSHREAKDQRLGRATTSEKEIA
jgi:hypothetical protein